MIILHARALTSGASRWPGLARRSGRCLPHARSETALNQPRILFRRADEIAEQRVGGEGFRLQLGVELHADEPRMPFDLDDLGKATIGRHAGKAQALRLQRLAILDVHLVAVAVAFLDGKRAIDRRDLRTFLQNRVIGPSRIVPPLSSLTLRLTLALP